MGRIDLGRVLGIPIILDTSWFMMLALVTWNLATWHFPSQVPNLVSWVYGVVGLLAALLLFVCVLLHELGHSLAAKFFRIPVARVTLFIFGGVAHIDDELKRPGVELVIALAGPAISLVISATCFWFAPQLPNDSAGQALTYALVRYLAVVNGMIMLFNLLPGFPLDGGRVLRAVLWVFTGDLLKATRIASLFGQALGLGLLGLGVYSMLRGNWLTGAWDVLLGMFLYSAARNSYLELVLRRKLGHV